MSNFRAAKFVSTLPGTLTPDTVYFVRVGTGFDMHVSDSTGLLSFTLNMSGGGGLSDGDKGDVTVSGSGSTIKIDAHAILGQRLAVRDGSYLL